MLELLLKLVPSPFEHHFPSSTATYSKTENFLKVVFVCAHEYFWIGEKCVGYLFQQCPQLVIHIVRL